MNISPGGVCVVANTGTEIINGEERHRSARVRVRVRHGPSDVSRKERVTLRRSCETGAGINTSSPPPLTGNGS